MIISVQAKLEERGVSLAALDAGLVEAFHGAVAGVAAGAHAEWERMASHRLRSARQIYINGLRQAESYHVSLVGGLTTYTITLVGEMPNNFEFGMPAFDMKAVRPGWLGGARAKTAQDGHKYVTIPFRHSLTSGAILAYTGKARQENVQAALADAVRKYGLRQMVRDSAGQVTPGTVRRVPNAAADVHRFLQGLTRVQQPVSGTTPGGLQRGSAQLMTWRVMSERSAPDAWVHPGLHAVNLLPDVERWINRELDHIMDLIFSPTTLTASLARFGGGSHGP